MTGRFDALQFNRAHWNCLPGMSIDRAARAIEHAMAGENKKKSAATFGSRRLCDPE